MSGDPTLDAIRIFVALVAVAGLSAVVTTRLALPYPVTLVVIGLLAGAILPAGEVRVEPELVLLVLLPGLVFEAALRLDIAILRRAFAGVVLLAAPGVLVTAAIVAVILLMTIQLPLGEGFVVGAIVAATDPVAVVSTFRRLGSPAELTTLVEGESLFNDGTALVVFAIAVRAASGGVGPVEGAVAFVVTVIASTVIGVAAGWLASRLISAVDDHLVELTLSLATAYGTYLLADGLDQSGIIATVVAGVLLGNQGRREVMSERAQDTLDDVWEFIAFVLTAFAFLLVGLSIPVADLVARIPAIAWGVVAVLIGRAVVVYGLLAPVGQLLAAAGKARLGERPDKAMPIGWLHVLFWAGLRGAVAVAMALSLPESFPDRALIQEIVFGVVLFTLFVQGTTAERVVIRAGAGPTRQPVPEPS